MAPWYPCGIRVETTRDIVVLVFGRDFVGNDFKERNEGVVYMRRLFC